MNSRIIVTYQSIIRNLNVVFGWFMVCVSTFLTTKTLTLAPMGGVLYTQDGDDDLMDDDEEAKPAPDEDEIDPLEE